MSLPASGFGWRVFHRCGKCADLRSGSIPEGRGGQGLEKELELVCLFGWGSMLVAVDEVSALP